MLRQLVLFEFEGKWGCPFSLNLSLPIGSVVVWSNRLCSSFRISVLARASSSVTDRPISALAKQLWKLSSRHRGRRTPFGGSRGGQSFGPLD